MSSVSLSVRELQTEDIPRIINYWLESPPDYLVSMGVDLKKVPGKPQLQKMLTEQLNQGYDQKQSYCTIWLVNNKPAGHCNVNRISFGKEAYIHLHFWEGFHRKKGYGTELVKKSLDFFSRNLHLTKICSEPYALNPAPNRTFEKAGFKFVKRYRTVPGTINFEQEVNLWEYKI